MTTAANADLMGLHDRMPVILDPAAWPVWLGEASGDHLALLRPAGVGVVRLWPVGRAVNSVRNNGADLLAPMDDAGPMAPADAPLDINPA
jgi:putative SOS response-associated peptidase YedK